MHGRTPYDRAAGFQLNLRPGRGALLELAGNGDVARKESWRKRGAAFFQSKARKRGGGSERQPDCTLPLDGGAASA